MVADLRRLNERLGRYAADVDAGAADGPFFNNDGLRAQLRRFDGGCEGSRAAPNDHEVIVCTRSLRDLPLPRDRALLPHEGTVARSLDGANESFIDYRVTSQDFGFPRLPGRQPDLVDAIDTCKRFADMPCAAVTGHALNLHRDLLLLCHLRYLRTPFLHTFCMRNRTFRTLA